MDCSLLSSSEKHNLQRLFGKIFCVDSIAAALALFTGLRNHEQSILPESGLPLR